MRVNHLLKHLQFSDSPPCRSLTIFDLGIELTENQCQSVCVSPLESQGSFRIVFPIQQKQGGHPRSWLVSSSVLISVLISQTYLLRLPLTSSWAPSSLEQELSPVCIGSHPRVLRLRFELGGLQDSRRFEERNLMVFVPWHLRRFLLRLPCGNRNQVSTRFNNCVCVRSRGVAAESLEI